jgi:coenzyme F420-reducing hydrogenase delta subunit/ferredoxin
VLVVGGGSVARELAERLVSAGYETLVLGEGPNGEIQGASTLRGELREVNGFLGAFEVIIGSGNEVRREKVGFVVAAPAAVLTPKFDAYGLSPSERVIALSDLEGILDHGDSLPDASGPWLHVVFLCGLEGETDPGELGRVLDAVEGLARLTKVQAHVFTREVKVGAAGLERRYRQARESGVLFYKFDEDRPVWEKGTRGPLLVFRDPVLGEEMELEPDLVVVDERKDPPPSLAPLLDAIPSTAAHRPFMLPDSSRFAGVETAKAGIFVLGEARGNPGRNDFHDEIEAVVTALKSAAEHHERPGTPGPPQVDQAKCTVCLTCVRLCPHGAISFRKRAEVDPFTCVRCGICAAECPVMAISLPPAEGGAQIMGMIESAFAREDSPGKIAAFLCSRSGGDALACAGAEVRRNLVPIMVPCAGTIDTAHVLAAFEAGAAGVLAAGCHKGNCASVYGTVLASERCAKTAAMLREAGLDGDRVVYTTVASNSPGELARGVRELERRIGIAK